MVSSPTVFGHPQGKTGHCDSVAIKHIVGPVTDLIIEPGSGLEGLALGAPKEGVRTFFGERPEVFRRTPDSRPADYWPLFGVFAYYDANDQLEALEFAPPANPVLDGSSLTSLRLGDAIQFLHSLDPELKIERDGAISDRLGVSIWSVTNDADQPVSAALIFRAGYYG